MYMPLKDFSICPCWGQHNPKNTLAKLLYVCGCLLVECLKSYEIISGEPYQSSSLIICSLQEYSEHKNRLRSSVLSLHGNYSSRSVKESRKSVSF